jgi:hypothetical protein
MLHSRAWICAEEDPGLTQLCCSHRWGPEGGVESSACKQGVMRVWVEVCKTADQLSGSYLRAGIRHRFAVSTNRRGGVLKNGLHEACFNDL